MRLARSLWCVVPTLFVASTAFAQLSSKTGQIGPSQPGPDAGDINVVPHPNGPNGGLSKPCCEPACETLKVQRPGDNYQCILDTEQALNSGLTCVPTCDCAGACCQGRAAVDPPFAPGPGEKGASSPKSSGGCSATTGASDSVLTAAIAALGVVLVASRRRRQVSK